MEHEIKVVIKYNGGIADHYKLDLYDAAKSLQGLSRAIAISTHAMVQEGEIRSRVDRIPDVSFYINPGQKGSFISIVSVVFSSAIVQTIGAGALSVAFWDMIRYSWNYTSGKAAEPQTRRIRNVLRSNENFPDAIAEELESPLEDFHAPIKDDRRVTIQIKKPRGEVIVELDINTYNHVITINNGGIQAGISGNVTKYNMLSGYGRFYSDENQKTIPFNLSSSMSDDEKGVLTESLNEATQHANGKILINATVIFNKLNEVKRYIIHSAYRS